MKTIKVKEMGAFKIYCVKKPLLVQECWISFVMGLRLSFFWGGVIRFEGKHSRVGSKSFFFYKHWG